MEQQVIIVTADEVKVVNDTIARNTQTVIQYAQIIASRMVEHESYNADTFPEGFDSVKFIKDEIMGSLPKETENMAERVEFLSRALTLTSLLYRLPIQTEFLRLDITTIRAFEATITAAAALEDVETEARSEQDTKLVTEMVQARIDAELAEEAEVNTKH